MDIPSVIAGIGLAGAGGLIFKLAYKGIIGNSRRNGIVTKEICDLKHNNVEQTLTDIKLSQTKIFDKIDDIHKFMPKRNGD